MGKLSERNGTKPAHVTELYQQWSHVVVMKLSNKILTEFYIEQ